MQLHILTLLALLVPGMAHGAQVTVAAAANFTDATRDLVPLFEEATGHTARVSYGSTGKLYAQIANGAPFDVFLAADGARPERAEKEGLAVPGTRFTYARGRLVLFSTTPGLFQDGEAYLREGDFTRAAIANPKTAPYGLAAQQVLEHLGLWEEIQARVVRGNSISQAFQFVATGNAEVGFVALSQVQAWASGAGSQWIIPQAYYAPIDQQALLLQRGADNAAARAFLEFLRGPQAREVILGYGYALE
jgi:molybdate transport system substrate-binding protein